MIIAALLIRAAAIFLLEPYVLSQLWGWFIVPLGVMAVGPAHVYGINLVLNLFSFKLINHKKTTDKEKVEKSVAFVGVVLSIWLIGYITKGIM